MKPETFEEYKERVKNMTPMEQALDAKRIADEHSAELARYQADEETRKARLATDGQWVTGTMLMWGGKRRNGLSLAITLTRFGNEDPFEMIAITSPRIDGGVQAVLDEHSHKVLECHTADLFEAIEFAQNYGREWLKQDTVDQPCTCDEIKE